MVGKTACGQQWSREQKIWQKIKIEASDKSTMVRFESFRPSAEAVLRHHPLDVTCIRAETTEWR